MDDDSDTPPDSIMGIVTRAVATMTCVVVALTGFWLAFPPHPAPVLFPVPPISPRIADSADYDHCLTVLATDPAAALTLADSWYATGGGDPAAHCLALGQIAVGDTEPAAEALSKLAASPKLTAPQRGAIEDQAAQAWMMAHDAERAFAALTVALSINPDEIDWLVDRAQVEVALDRAADALDDLNRALTLDSSRNWVRVLRGAVWRRLGQLPQARADIDIVLAQDSDHPGALLERGILHRLAQRDDAAQADWRHVIAVAPEQPEADIARHDLDVMETASGGRK